MARGDNDNGTKVSIPLVDVMGSVVMPTGRYPGYYLIMGKRLAVNEFRKRPLLLLAERECQTMSEVFDKLSDDLRRLKCRTLYAKQERNQREVSGFYRDLFQYLNSRRLNVNLMPAPSCNDYEYGRVLMVESFKSKVVELPGYVKTVLKGQLRDITNDSDVKDDALYAFHALRYILAGSEKYVNDIHPLFIKKDHKQTAALKWAAFGAV